MMIVVWILWFLGVGICVGFLGVVARDWIWRPYMLVQECRRQGIQGFPFVPIVGQMPAIDEVLKGRNRTGTRVDEDIITATQNCYRNHGNTFYFTIGKTVRLSIADPQLIKDILIANSNSYAKPQHVRVLGILESGIFASSGEIWAPQRQLLNGAFHTKEIKSKIPTMIECAHSATERWIVKLSRGQGEFDMYQEFAKLTLDVIGRTAFGAEIGGDSRSASAVIGRSNRYLLNCRELVFGPAAIYPRPLYGATKVKNEIAKDARWLTSFVESILRHREDRSRSRGGDDEVLLASAESVNASHHHDLLDVMMEATTTEPKKLTKKQLLDNALTFLLAGHETTASLLTWTIYLLAKHPLWQERARAEVEEFCPDGFIEPQVLTHLKLVGMILFESLRLFPPVPLIGRTCIQTNRVGPTLVVPEGLEIVIPVAVVHRDKSIWGENADKFWPARFGDGISGACGNPLAFIPFGAGPRTCIGQTLAISEAKAVLAVMLPLFTWKLASSYSHSPDVTLTMMPEFGMPIVLEKLH